MRFDLSGQTRGDGGPEGIAKPDGVVLEVVPELDVAVDVLVAGGFVGGVEGVVMPEAAATATIDKG